MSEKHGARRARESPGSSALPAALAAMQLLGKWTRLARGHVSFAMGCSCGAGFGGARVQDFEQDVLDYLHGKYGSGSAAAAFLRDRAGYVPGKAGNITELLRALAKEKTASEEQRSLLSDLERSIDSFDELHRGRQLS